MKISSKLMALMKNLKGGDMRTQKFVQDFTTMEFQEDLFMEEQSFTTWIILSRIDPIQVQLFADFRLQLKQKKEVAPKV